MRLFGCECETLVPMGSVPIGDYHCGTVQDNMSEYETVVSPEHADNARLSRWTAETDSSLRPNEGEEGAELVSPLFVLCGESARSAIEGLATWKHGTDARTNRSCGTHISVSTSRPWTSSDVATALTLATLIEPAVAAATGSEGRIGRGYATAMPLDGPHRPKPRHPNISGCSVAGTARESWFNLSGLRRTGGVRSAEHARIEIRAWTGTLNPGRLLAWSVLSAAIIDLIENRGGVCFPHELFDHCAPYGTGEQALRALFVSLGWSHRSGVGRPAPRPVRDLDNALGWREVADIGDAAGSPRTLPSIMDTLLNLARRHDARLGQE